MHAMELNNTSSLNVVLVMNLEQSSPLCVQSVVRRLREAGHHITLFACSSKGRFIPILEHPVSLLKKSVCQTNEDLLGDKVCKSDAVILITDYPVYEVPNYLRYVVEQFDGHIYSWISYGLTCSLLGGLVHDRQVAIKIRCFLEDSHNLLVGRILPQPCYFNLLYSVDPMLETPGPCVL